VRFDKLAESLGCLCMYVEKGEELGAAITKAFASGKPTVIHVPIDPVINHGGNQNLGKPNYDRFRTWYAEGQQ
jgi:thiamine pyrophosphate-dependent acetolactate synthase large subunit-like protein